MRELVLDTETTGIDPKDNHRIIEIGCVELVNFIPTGQCWHWYINPERDVPREATQIHGLTTAFLASKPVFSSVVDEVRSVVANARLIIHNAAFDVGFLNHEFGRLSHPPLGFENVVDTLALARRKHPGSPNSLDALCRRYGIDNAARTKHGALLDCELLADVYLKLMGAEQAGLNFSIQPVFTSTLVKAPVRMRDHPLPSRLTLTEQNLHTAFIAQMGQSAIWARYDESLA